MSGSDCVSTTSSPEDAQTCKVGGDQSCTNGTVAFCRPTSITGKESEVSRPEPGKQAHRSQYWCGRAPGRQSYHLATCAATLRGRRLLPSSPSSTPSQPRRGCRPPVLEPPCLCRNETLRPGASLPVALQLRATCAASATASGTKSEAGPLLQCLRLGSFLQAGKQLLAFPRRLCRSYTARWWWASSCSCCDRAWGPTRYVR